MIKVPPYLKKGDTIGIICTSGFMPAERAATCIQTLEKWGYGVQTGKTLGNQYHYFSGTDAERLEDLQQMLDDTNIKAILCARGGYGLSRIIDAVDFKKFKRHPKWIIGFSDITVLHAHIQRQFQIATLHSPMVSAFNDGGAEGPYVQSLKKALSGKPLQYPAQPHPFNRTGTVKGKLVGGNLAILAHLVGSASSLLTQKNILVIEDVGEYTYNADRMLIQLKRAGLLAGLAGLVVGGFTEMKDTTIPFGQDIYSIIQQHVAEYDYPVCFDFPVSHGTENYALKLGMHYQFTVTPKKVQLKEIR